jgi:predicted alpha/beta hydrolase family esterase
MKNAILLHGKPGRDEYYNPEHPSASNSHWFPWLQNQLMIRGIKADTPEVPLAFDPQWDLWVKEVERFEITSETILVGHSCGGGFWLKYLSLRPELSVGKVLLVAPWLDPKREDTTGFFNFEIDPKLIERTAGLKIFNSDDDFASIQESVSITREHEFPELLDAILGKID